ERSGPTAANRPAMIATSVPATISPEWTFTHRPLRTTVSAGLRPVATSMSRGVVSGQDGINRKLHVCRQISARAGRGQVRKLHGCPLHQKQKGSPACRRPLEPAASRLSDAAEADLADAGILGAELGGSR